MRLRHENRLAKEIAMSSKAHYLQGLYVISDDILTPTETIIEQITQALKGGAKVIQLRNKRGTDKEIKALSLSIQKRCDVYDALFVLNDKIEIAIELGIDGLHIGKSDHHRFEEIRKRFGGIIGVSCYDSVAMAKVFEEKGADYVAFGSFFHSHTKPNSTVIDRGVLVEAREVLKTPICAIGGITLHNIEKILPYKPDMVSVIHDIWSSHKIKKQAQKYSHLIEANTLSHSGSMI